MPLVNQRSISQPFPACDTFTRESSARELAGVSRGVRQVTR
jgi:hypothetical protein